MVGENRDLRQELTELRRDMELQVAKEVSLGRQIDGLKEDNARVVKMYE